MLAVLDIIMIVLRLFVWVLIIQAVLSWLMAFGVINTRNQFVDTVYRFTHQLTEPFLKPIRQHVPPMNGLDLSFLILWLLVILVQQIIIRYAYPAIASAGL